MKQTADERRSTQILRLWNELALEHSIHGICDRPRSSASIGGSCPACLTDSGSLTRNLPVDRQKLADGREVRKPVRAVTAGVKVLSVQGRS
jgi:hypothetical protein